MGRDAGVSIVKGWCACVVDGEGSGRVECVALASHDARPSGARSVLILGASQGAARAYLREGDRAALSVPSLGWCRAVRSCQIEAIDFG